MADTTRLPANQAAQLIAKLEQQNKDIDTQIFELVKVQQSNKIIIDNAEALADWETPVEVVNNAVIDQNIPLAFTPEQLAIPSPPSVEPIPVQPAE